MKLFLLASTLLLLLSRAGLGWAQAPWLLSAGSYCLARTATPGQKGCCDGRQDECSRPYLDTTCYCDQFCDRAHNSDCCPDYKRVCLGEREQPPPQTVVRCFHEGKYYPVGEHAQDNCNKCTCHETAVMECERRACLIRPEVISGINAGNYGWRAANYSMFWGKSLEDGYRLWAGICKPDHPVMSQTSVQNSIENQQADGPLDDHFDARHKWPRLIRPITDQMAYPASWAISTVDVASDRLAIQSGGEQQLALSAQNLISCIHPRKHACATSTDRAWWYLSVFGVVEEQCYPYHSGYNSEKEHCQVIRDTWSEHSNCAGNGEGRGRQGEVYRSPPAYRVSSKEEDIMTEIRSNGPVQALLHVHNDFFYYREGVYRHTSLSNDHQLPIDHHVHRHLAVRIIGWGVEGGAKFWLCANSWGSGWGEGGYFKIARGADESGIEMFVVGVWAKKAKNGNKEYSNYVED